MDASGFTDLALGLPDAVVVVDASGVVRWANRTAERLFGIALDDVIGTNAFDLVHAEDRDVAAVSLVSVHHKEVGTPIELRVRTANGWKLVELVGSNLLDAPSVGGIVLSLRDLTERRRWEVATNETERFRSLVHNARSVLMLLDHEARVLSVSAAITRVLGHDQEQVEGRPLGDFVADHDRGRLEVSLSRAISGHGPPGGTVVEVDLLRRDGGARVPFELSIVNLLDDPTVEGLIVSAHDISQLRAARDALERLATRDPLTGLPNRTLILERVEQMLARAHRLGSPAALLFVDVDHFKNVNDSLGHRVGDEVLRQVAARFVSALRGSDTIGRLGGDEFVVLVEDTTSEDSAEAVADRLLLAFAQPFYMVNEMRPHSVSASIGIAVGEYASAEDLVADADIALYEAKAAGRNRYVRFQSSMRGRFHDRVDLDRDLMARR
jgi:diguanylate cyclase (GGDEF)-like protein/PAS domain S-box-containing protein